MKVLTLTCPQCGGNLAENSKFCPCCGTPVMVDDSSAKQKITWQQVDDARLREADVHEKVRLKELEIEYLKMQTETRQKQTAQRAKVLVAVLLVMILVGLLLGYVFVKDEYGHENSDFLSFALLMLPVICIVIPLLFRTKK